MPQGFGITPGTWNAVGFSNGANIASALLLLRPSSMTAAALLAAMVPFREPPQADLTGHRARKLTRRQSRNEPLRL